jgi:tetratricopeptide (TPR) repeat protein
MTEGLVGDKRRQATDSIRGYVYQAYQSVLAWMRLGKDEVLFLEGAEDFDVHSADGVTATQVKDTAGSGTLTLRSADAVAAINNLWRHQQNNPDKVVGMRFLTTASPGREKGGEFGRIATGIEYWSAAKRDDTIALEPLKSFLLSLELQPSLADFLRSSDDLSIRKNLICRIDWDTGAKPIDGLDAAIKDELVCFGARKGIDSYQSEKVLDTLLRRVADLLSSNGERRLGYADFVREFEQATMELVSREEAVTLRAGIGQITHLAQMANSPILTDLNRSPNVLGAPLRLMEGAVARSALVDDLAGVLRDHGVLFLRGSTGLGKTSLAQLLVDKIAGEWVWAGFRGRDPRQIADHLRRAAFEIKVRGLPPRVVLDDLDLGPVAQFERELLSIVFSISNQYGAVVVTGPTACPADLLAKLWLPLDCNREVLYFDEGDVRDVLLNHGLAEPKKLDQWSRLTWILTAGHPQLVHARVRNLQSKGWPPVVATDFLKTEDLEHVRTTARRRLIDELPSEGARYIAYRLSLITGEFSRQTALGLAQLPPPVALPGEAFEGLVGPWIETVGNDCYRVSPLLSNAGGQTLSQPEQTAVHTAVAFGFLKRGTLTPVEFGMALKHAFLAKSEWALILLAKATLTLDHGTLRAISDAAFWFPVMALEPGQQISRNIATATFLRLAQFRIAVAGREIDSALLVIDRTLELLEQIDDQELAQANEVIAYTLFLNTIDIPIPPRRAITMLARLMELGESNEHLAESTQNFRQNDLHTTGDFSGFSPFQILFSFETTRISGIDALGELLDALDGLNVEKRQSLIELLEKDTGRFARLLINASWWKDASRDTLDIDKALTTFRKAIVLGRVWSSLCLVRASYIAMSVIYDEYNNTPDNALAVLDEAATDFGGTDVHILNQRAKVMFRRGGDDEAVDLFSQALAGDGLDPVERAFSGRNGGMAAACSGDWHSAAELFLMGASAAEAFPGFKSLAAGLKADAAFARWKQGCHADALRLYAEVLELLEHIPIDENSQTHHIHAAVRHCLGWIVMSTAGGSGEGLADPVPGICSNPEPIANLKDRSLIDMAAVWGLLGHIDTRLGTGLGLMHQAEQKSNGALSLNVRCWERSDRYQALWNGTDLPRAVPLVIGLIEGSVCLKELNAAQRDGWAPGDITPLPDDYWEDQNNRAYLLFTLLAVSVLATSSHPDNPLPVEAWRNDMSLHHVAGPEVDRFFALLGGTERQSDGSLLEEAALALSRIRDGMLQPNDLFICHFRLLNALLSGKSGEHAGDALAKIVAAQWLNVSENQRFALTSPVMYAPTLREKCEDTIVAGFIKVASVLKTAALATGARVADSGIEYLIRVERGEAPPLASA